VIERERGSREYKKGTSERSGSIYIARVVGLCEDASLTEHYTRSGRTPFLDVAIVCSRLYFK